MNKTISFKSSGPSGDLTGQLAGIKQICTDQDAKADIFMHLDVGGFYYPGAIHPYGTSMFPQKAFDMMKPLVEAQSYINSFQVFSGQQIQVSLDKHRERQCGLPMGSMHRWIGYVYHELQTDLSKKWISTLGDPERIDRLWDNDPSITTHLERKILINRTSRYQNGWVNYFFLKKYQDKLIFTGLPEEHQQFCKDWNLEMPLLHVENFYEMAVALDSCKFFIGNQSMCYNIAEGMKIPRLLEVCDFAPNVIPIGKHAYDFRFQESLEYFVDKMDREL